MKNVIDLAWKQNLAFQCDMDGHHLVIDASKEGGGDDLGPRPKKLMLTALAAGTGPTRAWPAPRARCAWPTSRSPVAGASTLCPA